MFNCDGVSFRAASLNAGGDNGIFIVASERLNLLELALN